MLANDNKTRHRSAVSAMEEDHGAVSITTKSENRLKHYRGGLPSVGPTLFHCRLSPPVLLVLKCRRAVAAQVLEMLVDGYIDTSVADPLAVRPTAKQTDERNRRRRHPTSTGQIRLLVPTIRISISQNPNIFQIQTSRPNNWLNHRPRCLLECPPDWLDLSGKN